MSYDDYRDLPSPLEGGGQDFISGGRSQCNANLLIFTQIITENNFCKLYLTLAKKLAIKS